MVDKLATSDRRGDFFNFSHAENYNWLIIKRRVTGAGINHIILSTELLKVLASAKK